MKPIHKAIEDTVKCVKCGAGYGKCDCWEKCPCGWLKEKGGECDNPDHKRIKIKGRQQ